MNILKNYQAGVNLGGWLSQYSQTTQEHYDTFITESDIEQIASWGMDHIRLPFDYHIIDEEENPLQTKENGFSYIDKCIEWCKKYNLNLVLDLHKTPGFSFNTLNANALFDEETLQNRFIDIWREFSLRYVDEKDNIIFELLNEVVDKDSSRWNALAKKAVAAIRSIDKERGIIIGSNCYSIVGTLNELDILDDPYIIYNFHFYEPFFFTHQRAGFSEMHAEYNKVLTYPGEYIDLKEFLDSHPEYDRFSYLLDQKIDKEVVLQWFKYVTEFMETKAAGKLIYCGEFGVISRAPQPSQINWYRDFIDIVKELKIGHAVWSYKKMDFGLVDANSKVICEELVKILSEKYE